VSAWSRILEFSSYLLKGNYVARRTFQCCSGEVDFQVSWKVSPPISKFRTFCAGALVCARWGQISGRVVMLYEDLVENLCKCTHLYKTRNRMRLLRWIIRSQETMGCPSLNLSRVVHCKELVNCVGNRESSWKTC